MGVKHTLWHGTGFPEEIVESGGFDPNPETKVWAEEEADLETVGGTYFTDNLEVAMRRAFDAQMNAMGELGLVCVEIDADDLVADEDTLRAEAHLVMRNTDLSPDVCTNSRARDRIQAWLHGTEDWEVEEVVKGICSRFHGREEETVAKWLVAWHDDLLENTEEAKRRHFEAVDEVSRAFPRTGRLGFGGSNSVRALDPVTFEGRSRILAVGIVRTSELGLKWEGFETLYGEFPEDRIDEEFVRELWDENVRERGAEPVTEPSQDDERQRALGL